MDRKKFLQLTSSSAMAGMALASVPKLLRGKSQPFVDTYIGTWDESEGVDIELNLYSEAILDYSNAEGYRTVYIKLLKKLDNQKESDVTTYDELFNAIYRIVRPPIMIDKEQNIYRVQADLSSVEINEANVPSSEITFEIQFGENIDRVGLPFAGRTVILEKSATFICSACMQARGVPLDCWELEILRLFRNQYAMQSSEGRQLIREYAIVGPLLVDAIENSVNRKKIYAAVYDSLVLPAIDLIKEGRKETAMQFYKKYVEGLYQKFS